MNNTNELILGNYQRRKNILLLFAVTLVAYLLIPGIMLLADGLGGLVSEKLIDRAGTTSSLVMLDRSGTTGSVLDVGQAPAIITAEASNVIFTDKTYATLNGTISDMNNFPSTTVYWEWGYGTSYDNIVGSQVASATGDYSVNIDSYDPAQYVCFRFVSEADGINYGNTQLLRPGSSTAGAYRLAAILPIIFLTIIILAIVGSIMTGEFTIAALLAIAIGIMIGVTGLAPIQEALRALWGG